MTDKSQQQKGRDSALFSLNVAIDALDLARELSPTTTPAMAVLGSVTALLTVIRDSVINKGDYVELGLACAGVCEALSRGIDGRREDQLSQPVLGAIEKLTTTVNEIQRNMVRRGKRNPISRRIHAKDEKETIAGWRSELDRILHVFNTELGTNDNGKVSETPQDGANGHTTASGARHSNGDTVTPDVRHNSTNVNRIVSGGPE